MKKLIMAAAIVCAAAVSQAASVSWAAKNIVGPGTDAGLYSGAAVLHIFEGKAIGDTELAAINGTMTDGVISMTGIDLGSYGFDVGDYVTAYYTMAAKVDGKDYVFTSSTKTVKGLDNKDAPMNFVSAGSWTPVAVPEPTSGLLLLLGVAGLALRRRRA